MRGLPNPNDVKLLVDKNLNEELRCLTSSSQRALYSFRFQSLHFVGNHYYYGQIWFSFQLSEWVRKKRIYINLTVNNLIACELWTFSNCLLPQHNILFECREWGNKCVRRASEREQCTHNEYVCILSIRTISHFCLNGHGHTLRIYNFLLFSRTEKNNNNRRKRLSS